MDSNNNSGNNSGSDEPNFIYSYTAKQAIEDGFLHQIGNISYESGFKIPIRITTGVLDLVTPDQKAQEMGQSYEGRLWDVLTLARAAVLKSGRESDLVSFEVIFQDGTGKRKKVTLWIGLDITSGLALHIMLPEEY